LLSSARLEAADKGVLSTKTTFQRRRPIHDHMERSCPRSRLLRHLRNQKLPVFADAKRQLIEPVAVNLRHGVSRIRAGMRHTAGIIFHDAM
jgi:hypothetical protein